MTPALNKPLPEFEAVATGGVKFTPQGYVGQTVVLYFYPKDHTPGCTTEAMQFRDKHKEFVKAGAVVFGVSRDNLASHDKFKENLELPYELNLPDRPRWRAARRVARHQGRRSRRRRAQGRQGSQARSGVMPLG